MVKKITNFLFIGLITVLLLELTLRFLTSGFLFLRNPISFKNHENSLRILTVGESTTAYGFADGYPRQLEVILERELGRDVQVINVSTPGTTTGELLQELPNYLNEYKPHIVTFMTGINDETFSNQRNGFLENFAVYRLSRLILSGEEKQAEVTLRKESTKWGKSIRFSQPSSEELERIKTELLHAKFHSFSVEDIISQNSPVEFLPALFNEYFYTCNVRRHEECKKLFEILSQVKSLKYDKSIWLEYFRSAVGAGDFKAVDEAGDMLIQINPNEAQWVAMYAHNNFNEVQGWRYWEITSDFYEAWRKNNISKKEQKEILGFHLEFLLTTMTSSPFPTDYEKIKNYVNQLVQRSEFSEDGEIQSIVGKINTIKERVSIKEAPNKKTLIGNFKTHQNQRAMAILVKKMGAQAIILQYPMLSIDPLRYVYFGLPVLYVENKTNFESLVSNQGFSAAFIDSFAETFGHFSPEGHKLVAEELAKTILENININSK